MYHQSPGTQNLIIWQYQNFLVPNTAIVLHYKYPPPSKMKHYDHVDVVTNIFSAPLILSIRDH